MSYVLFGKTGALLARTRIVKLASGMPQRGKRGGCSKRLTYRMAFVLTISLSLFGTMSQIEAAESVILKVQPRPESFQQVKVAIEVSGDLKINADGKEVRKVPMTVEANLLYHERFLPTEKGLRTVRHFQEAAAVMTINSQPMQNTLRADRRLIGMQSIDDETTLFSPQGPLSREELDLIDVPGRLAGVIAALPGEGVEVGAEWSVSDVALTQLLCVEAVTKNEVLATFKELKDGIALIRLEGRVSAAVAGISTEIDLKASLNINVAKQQATWLAMGISENRAVGHAQPGFNAVSRVRVALQPCGADPQLTTEALTGLALVPTDASTVLERESTQGGFAFFHDRRWLAMVDRHDVTILRLVDRGDLVAQCNMSNLAPLPAKEQLTLEGFQADVRNSVGESFGSFVESTQKLNENGLAVLRVVVVGNVQEVPIEWIYYHITESSGRRVSLVFTHDTNVAERFGGADHSIVSTLRFLPRPATTAKGTVPGLPMPAATDKSISQKPTSGATQKK